MTGLKNILITALLVQAGISFSQIEIHSEDFQAGIPLNYSIVDNDGLQPDDAVSEYTNAWISVADPEDASNLVAASTSFFSPIGQADRWLITPPLELGPFGNFISWNAKSHDASFPDDYLVLISSTNTDISSFIDTVGSVDEEYAEWTSRTVDLSDEGYNDQTIYVAFVNRTNDGFKLYIDDVLVWKEDPASVLEADIIEMKVHPNPFQDILKVSTTALIESFELKDLSGKIVAVSTENELIVDFLPAGVFIATVKTEKGTRSFKVIKS
jgi:hypothetical protein